jgi:D-alanine-D-alanine ligase-like ATP-grasp enzyme
MGHQILHGLNIESKFPTIKIDLGTNQKELLEIIEKIDSFHPLFLEEYTIKDNILTIRSHVIDIWRDASPTLQKLSNGEINKEEAEEYIIDQLIHKKFYSMSSIPLIEAAYKKNLEVTNFYCEEGIFGSYWDGYAAETHRNYVFGCGRNSQTIASVSSSRDSNLAKKTQKDKWTTNLIIERLGLPIAKWEIIDSEEELKDIFEKYEKPVVIKPAGLTGGSGVSVGIKTLDQALKAYSDAKEKITGKIRKPWQTKIMIQEQLEGDDYRLLVINGKLKIATKRIPAFITGDGKSTIKELIEETNKDPRRDTSNPSHILKPIEIDKPLHNYLEEQGLSLDIVPEKDKRIFVRKVASMSRGGITEDFTDTVSPEIKLIVESLASSIHAFALGVDVMCKDLNKPLTKDNGGIIEINTMPEAYLNFFPVLGKTREYVAEEFVDELLEFNKTKKIVCIGNYYENISGLLRRKRIIKENEKVGEIYNGKIKIDNYEINDDLDMWKGIEGLKINGSLDHIIVQYRDWREVREFGLGFNSIDYLFITKKEFSMDKEFMRKIRKYKLMGLIDKIRILK